MCGWGSPSHQRNQARHSNTGARTAAIAVNTLQGEPVPAALPPRFRLEVLLNRTRVTLPARGALDIATAAQRQSAVDEFAKLGHTVARA